MALTVLLVEDDAAIRTPLARGLAREGFDVRTAADGEEGLRAGLDPEVDMVVLDVRLPRLDGLEVCRRLRRARPRVWILLLSALAEEVHTVDGLDAGADDYVTKPFRLAELVARLRAAGRRVGPLRQEAGSIVVDRAANRAWCGDDELALSPKEFDLLARLVADAGAVVAREVLLNDVWGPLWIGSGRTLDQHVLWLRRKLGDSAITTVRGRGYRLEVGAASEGSQTEGPDPGAAP